MIAVIVALGLAAPTAAAAPSPYCATQNAIFKDRRAFVGLSDPYVEAGSARFRNCSFGRMAVNHIGIFRGGLSWAQTQYPSGQYAFGTFDRLVADLARHHIRFFPVLLDPPRWASTQPAAGTPQGVYPPARPAQFAAWTSACVRRYGPGGTFCRANPRLPYYPVKAWQVWNEPNIKTFWAPHTNPAAYVRLLRATSAAIKRVDRHAIVVTAGMRVRGCTRAAHGGSRPSRPMANKIRGWP